MAEQSNPTRNETPGQRGGLQGGESSRARDIETRDAGTPGIAAPSGDVHLEPTSQATPRTPLADRAVEVSRLAGGKTPDMIRDYLGGITFPIRKDELIHAARRNGAASPCQRRVLVPKCAR